MRGLLRYWPPRMVSAKWTRQLSRSSTLRHGGRDAAFGHDGVRFAEQRFADHADAHAGRRGFDGRAQARAARADHQHIVFEGLIIGHQRILQSVQMPMAHSRTYRSENAYPEQTEPGEEHVTAVETAHAVIGFLAGWMPRELIDDAAHQVAQRMAAERVAAEQDDVDEQHQRADADAEVPIVRELRGLVDVVSERGPGTRARSTGSSDGCFAGSAGSSARRDSSCAARRRRRWADRPRTLCSRRRDSSNR